MARRGTGGRGGLKSLLAPFAIQALASLAHTSVTAQPGQVQSGDHMLCTRPQTGAKPRRRFRSVSGGPR
jgi:hypothetical protein